MVNLAKSARALFKYLHGRQFFAFEKLQERAASSRNVGYPVINAIFLDCSDGVAATRQSEGLGIGNGHGDGLGTGTELIELEHADRPIPDNSAGFHDNVRQLLSALRTNIKNHLIIDNRIGIF